MSQTNQSQRSDVQYETFELLIGARQQDGYPISILQSLAGEEDAFCHLDPVNDERIQEMLERISNNDTDHEFLKEFGTELFQNIFVDKIEALFRKHIGMMQGQEKYLRLRLRIKAPELAALPWEYLYDKESDTFFAIDCKKALVRYIPMNSSKRPSLVTPPLRVLVVISNPKDYPQLDVEQEKKIIAEALEKLVREKKIRLQILESALIVNINQAMRDFSPHIFHFIGHATFSDEEGGAEIILLDENGAGLSIDEETFSCFFQNASDIRVAVFNACETAASSSSHLLSGLAAAVLKHELSAVVGMQYAISDEAAQIFSREFYRSLAVGDPLEVAISEARKGIFMETGKEKPDWGYPVLFLRSKDGQLFKRKRNPNRSIKPLLQLPLPVELKGKQLQELQKALLSAFQSYSSLEQMVKFKLDENLRHIAASKNGLSDVVFELIGWANSHGKVEELVRGAREQNRGNPKLKAFADKYLATPTEKPSTSEASSTSPQGSNYILSFSERGELVECLLAIPSIADRGTLSSVIEELRPEIKMKVRHSSVHKTYVLNLVKTCLQYPNGMQDFRDILEFFEGDSIPMQRFQDALNRLLPRE